MPAIAPGRVPGHDLADAPAATARRQMEKARVVAERRADAAIAQAREDARVRVADLEAQLRW